MACIEHHTAESYRVVQGWQLALATAQIAVSCGCAGVASGCGNSSIAGGDVALPPVIAKRKVGGRMKAQDALGRARGADRAPGNTAGAHGRLVPVLSAIALNP